MPTLLFGELFCAAIQECYDLSAGTLVVGTEQVAADTARDALHIAPRHGFIAPFWYIGQRYEKHEKDADRFIALIDKYENFDKLTIAMLNEFIEKILVHERDRKGSIQTTQEVEIYLNFVGRFVPPAFGEVELTPEELEVIRKREERKDRLHQNYLKRKASGAQKRYEDKIKERKKAEIEAKKAAICAEDIAKGVFIPVSNLPQREPMKGSQIA